MSTKVAEKAKAQRMLDAVKAGQSLFSRTPEGMWTVVGPVDDIVTGATVTVTKASGETSQVIIGKVGPVFTAQGCSYRVGGFKNVQAERTHTAPRSSYRSSGYSAPRDRSDHEDCLSMGGCVHGSPSCPYTFAHNH